MTEIEYLMTFNENEEESGNPISYAQIVDNYIAYIHSLWGLQIKDYKK